MFFTFIAKCNEAFCVARGNLNSLLLRSGHDVRSVTDTETVNALAIADRFNVAKPHGRSVLHRSFARFAANLLNTLRILLANEVAISLVWPQRLLQRKVTFL
jgi:hypothetical protein